MRETKRHRRRNNELELECYVISMIAELRFVFGENEIVRDLRERELVINERLRGFFFLFFLFFNIGRLGIAFSFLPSNRIAYSFVFLNIFLKFFSRVENFFGYFY